MCVAISAMCAVVMKGERWARKAEEKRPFTMATMKHQPANSTRVSHQVVQWNQEHFKNWLRDLQNKTTTALFCGKVRPTVEGKSGSGEPLLLGPHSLPRTQSWWVSGAEASICWGHGSQAGSRVTLPGHMHSGRWRDRNHEGWGKG